MYNNPLGRSTPTYYYCRLPEEANRKWVVSYTSGSLQPILYLAPFLRYDKLYAKNEVFTYPTLVLRQI